MDGRSVADLAREARRDIEMALDHNVLAAAGWPWCRRLSLWVDALTVLADSEDAA
jgi:hypothetical protein